jgi:hypothetical protein
VRRRDMTAAAKRYATFAEFYPFYSFLGDWVMWKEILTGKIRF